MLLAVIGSLSPTYICPLGIFGAEVLSVDIGKLKTSSGNFIFLENLMTSSASREMLAMEVSVIFEEAPARAWAFALARAEASFRLS